MNFPRASSSGALEQFARCDGEARQERLDVIFLTGRSHSSGRGLSCAGKARGMARKSRKKRYLTATLPDGYVKTIGPTADPFTHYWRIVAELENGKTEVFWGHTRSLAEAKKLKGPAGDGARKRGWTGYRFEIAELVESEESPESQL